MPTYHFTALPSGGGQFILEYTGAEMEAIWRQWFAGAYGSRTQALPCPAPPGEDGATIGEYDPTDDACPLCGGPSDGTPCTPCCPPRSADVGLLRTHDGREVPVPLVCVCSHLRSQHRHGGRCEACATCRDFLPRRPGPVPRQEPDPDARFLPCTHGPCSHLGTRHAPGGDAIGKCLDCPCIEFRPWTPPPALPRVTETERARLALRHEGGA